MVWGHSYHQAEHQMGRKGGNLESSPALEPLSLPAWRGQSSRVEMSRSGEKNWYQTPESSLKTSAPCLRGPHHLESSLARYWGGHSGHHFSRVGCIPAVNDVANHPCSDCGHIYNLQPTFLLPLSLACREPTYRSTDVRTLPHHSCLSHHKPIYWHSLLFLFL